MSRQRRRNPDVEYGYARMRFARPIMGRKEIEWHCEADLVYRASIKDFRFVAGDSELLKRPEPGDKVLVYRTEDREWKLFTFQMFFDLAFPIIQATVDKAKAVHQSKGWGFIPASSKASIRVAHRLWVYAVFGDTKAIEGAEVDGPIWHKAMSQRDVFLVGSKKVNEDILVFPLLDVWRLSNSIKTEMGIENRGELLLTETVVDYAYALKKVIIDKEIKTKVSGTAYLYAHVPRDRSVPYTIAEISKGYWVATETKSNKHIKSDATLQLVLKFISEWSQNWVAHELDVNVIHRDGRMDRVRIPVEGAPETLFSWPPEEQR